MPCPIGRDPQSAAVVTRSFIYIGVIQDRLNEEGAQAALLASLKGMSCHHGSVSLC